MSVRNISWIAGLLLVLGSARGSCGQEPAAGPGKSSSPAAASDFLRLGEMAQAAADLRKAGEAFERFSGSLEGLAESMARSLATMSSEFDPFGYKTAFRTVGRQAEMLNEQRELIQALQQREIRRLQRENRRLRRELQARKAGPAGSK